MPTSQVGLMPLLQQKDPIEDKLIRIETKLDALTATYGAALKARSEFARVQAKEILALQQELKDREHSIDALQRTLDYERDL